jgi:hypothetical protein
MSLTIGKNLFFIQQKMSGKSVVSKDVSPRRIVGQEIECKTLIYLIINK